MCGSGKEEKPGGGAARRRRSQEAEDSGIQGILAAQAHWDMCVNVRV